MLLEKDPPDVLKWIQRKVDEYAKPATSSSR